MRKGWRLAVVGTGGIQEDRVPGASDLRPMAMRQGAAHYAAGSQDLQAARSRRSQAMLETVTVFANFPVYPAHGLEGLDSLILPIAECDRSQRATKAARFGISTERLVSL